MVEGLLSLAFTSVSWKAGAKTIIVVQKSFSAH
jgi:hypothetical protein